MNAEDLMYRDGLMAGGLILVTGGNTGNPELRQALAGGRQTGIGGVHCDHLGLERLALRGTLGHVQGRY